MVATTVASSTASFTFLKVLTAVSATFSVVLSTPVNTSTSSLPASFTLSIAPLKSPANTLSKAFAKNPITSKADLNLSIMLSISSCPKSFNACPGFLNALTKPYPKLDANSIRSLNKSLTVSNAIANFLLPSSEDLK